MSYTTYNKTHEIRKKQSINYIFLFLGQDNNVSRSRWTTIVSVKENNMVQIVSNNIEVHDDDHKSLKYNIQQHIKYTIGVPENKISIDDVYTALALSLRSHLIDNSNASEIRNQRVTTKKVHYLSLEFLIGKCTESNLINLGLYEEAKSVVADYGFSISDVLEKENDPALGNGGLGRLAACFLDSMATTDVAGYGYGINYDFGLFKQSISNGYQKETPDNWKSDGIPYLIERKHRTKIVPVYGTVFDNVENNGAYNPSWMNWKTIIGVPYDLPILGFNKKRTNFLRLYSAKSSDEFDIKIFNDGDYIKAVEQKLESQRISKILYPEDSTISGKELRLLQEYFFVSCSVRDIVDDHLEIYDSCINLSEYNAIQLNDTHPALAVPELMRILIDEQRLNWDDAWQQTVATCSYTNHTLLPEALETWLEDLIAKVLPRHLQIIKEIDERFQVMCAGENIPPNHIEKMKICTTDNDGNNIIRMANLSIIGCHTTNGVAALHTELVKSDLVPEFYQLWPNRFQNKTNGVTPRRWLHQCNPALSSLITDTIGDKWITELSELSKLEEYKNDSSFREQFDFIKTDNKKRLANTIFDTCRIRVDHDSLFDIQIKRIHEYKRQLLNILQVINLYFEIVDDRKIPTSPVTHIFAGKAAPGYFMAKRIIKLINAVAMVVNQDPRASEWLKVVFIPDYRVSLAEIIFPAANISEQISTAGFEASGTGNMKFAMNGALTLGTLDGANVEILEEAGAENIYIFGKNVEEIQALKNNDYNPWDYYNNNFKIKRALDALNSDTFSPGEPGLFEPLYYNLLSGGDYFCVLADFESYLDAQYKVRTDFADHNDWTTRSILNVARSSKFSSDRTISEYCEDIWNIKPTYKSV